MRNQIIGGASSAPWKPAVVALALSAVLACGLFGSDPDPTPAPALVSTNILTPTPTVQNPSADDRPEETIIAATPQPTYTPFPTPTPYPTSTPYPTPPPTFTPAPTHTPVPTTTPYPTSTPYPTPPPTFTPAPTYTPIPTATPFPTPQPTYTPEPTYTPVATPTPHPTPQPTFTPEPTSTPTPTPTFIPTQLPTPVATSTPWATDPTPVPRVPRSWDHPDVWGNREAALAASQQRLVEICGSDVTLKDSTRVRGVGLIVVTQFRLPDDLAANFHAVDNLSRFRHTHIQALCVVVPPNIEATLWDATAQQRIFEAASGRNVFSWREGFSFYDKYLNVRCLNCEEEGESQSNVVTLDGDDKNAQYIAVYWLHPDSTTERDMKEYWVAAQDAKIAENERLLREIRVNWLNWLDRVDRGHPVYEVETDDLSRQCERAETLTAELDALEATDYRNWFDVCQEP